VILLLYH